MQIKKTETGLNLRFNLDNRNYEKFLWRIKRLAKRHEYDSDQDKLKYSLSVSGYKTPNMDVKGWVSRCVDEKGRVFEVFFCDYDNILYSIVEAEIRYVIEEFNLSPAYIFSTEEYYDKITKETYGNYLVVILTKLPFRDIIKIQNLLHCDQAFKQIPLINRYKTYVLRLGKKGLKPKPKFKCVIGDLNKKYNQEISKPHLITLNTLYPETKNLVKYTNNDKRKLEKLYVVDYITASK